MTIEEKQLSIDLIRWYNIWPDDVEDRKEMYLYCCEYIDSFPGDPVEHRESSKELMRKHANI